MAYSVLAQAVVVAHFAFLAYLALGGFLAWRERWRASIWVHIAVVGWGVSIITVGQECPLTYLENWARRAGGGHDLSGGFINTYLTGVVYPPAYLAEVRVLVAVTVLVSWIGCVRRRRIRRHRIRRHRIRQHRAEAPGVSAAPGEVAERTQ